MRSPVGPFRARRWRCVCAPACSPCRLQTRVQIRQGEQAGAHSTQPSLTECRNLRTEKDNRPSFFDRGADLAYQNYQVGARGFEPPTSLEFAVVHDLVAISAQDRALGDFGSDRAGGMATPNHVRDVEILTAFLPVVELQGSVVGETTVFTDDGPFVVIEPFAQPGPPLVGGLALTFLALQSAVYTFPLTTAQTSNASSGRSTRQYLHRFMTASWCESTPRAERRPREEVHLFPWPSFAVSPIGATGFEPATSRSRRVRKTLHKKHKNP